MSKKFELHIKWLRKYFYTKSLTPPYYGTFLTFENRASYV